MSRRCRRRRRRRSARYHASDQGQQLVWLPPPAPVASGRNVATRSPVPPVRSGAVRCVPVRPVEDPITTTTITAYSSCCTTHYTPVAENDGGVRLNIYRCPANVCRVDRRRAARVHDSRPRWSGNYLRWHNNSPYVRVVTICFEFYSIIIDSLCALRSRPVSRRMPCYGVWKTRA